MIELFEGVRDAAYTIINKKGATYYGIAVALARITKAILDDENAVLPLSVFQEGQYGVSNVFIGQPAIVGAHGIVRPVNIPLNDAEQQKMKASADELQAIIDEAWKNPEFQEASKNQEKNISLLKRGCFLAALFGFVSKDFKQIRHNEIALYVFQRRNPFKVCMLFWI